MRRLLQANASGRGAEMGLGRMESMVRASTTLEAWWGPARNASQSDKVPGLVHVAGTNGKGSVSHKINYGIMKHGKGTCGLFTSPHVGTYRERIRLDNVMIPETQAEALMEEIEELENKLDTSLTYFELLTMLSFQYFAKSKAAYAVIEAGLGGLEDSTNVMPPPGVCVITSIALDHQAILGNTLDDIARAKGGIFKKGCNVVVGPSVPAQQLQVLREISEAAEAKSFTALEPVSGESVDGENTRVAATALHFLGINVPVSELLDKRPLGRFEKVNNRLILDAAHNPAAFVRLGEALAQEYPRSEGWKIHAVVAMGANKDALGSFQALLADKKLNVASITVAPSENLQRSASIKDLEAAVQQAADLSGREDLEVHHAPTIVQAFDLAQAQTNSDKDVHVVCGSFNALGHIRARFFEDMAVDEINMNENKV